MSVSKKVLRKMKKVMGVIGAIPVLVACSSQISRALVNVEFDSSTGTLRFSGNGEIGMSWQSSYESSSVKSVVIENGIKEISDSAFHDCESLREIIIPNSVYSIGEYAFCCCKSLKKITIPNSVNIIGKFAFWNCANLGTVEFEGMSLIRNNSYWDVMVLNGAFGLCKELKIFNTSDRNVKIMAGVFLGCGSNFVKLEGKTVQNISIIYKG